MSELVCNICGDAVQCYDPEGLGLGCKKSPCPGHYHLVNDNYVQGDYVLTDSLVGADIKCLNCGKSVPKFSPQAIVDYTCPCGDGVYVKLTPPRPPGLAWVDLVLDTEKISTKCDRCGGPDYPHCPTCYPDDLLPKCDPLATYSPDDRHAACRANERRLMEELAEMKRTLENTEKLVDMTARISIDESARKCIGDAISERDQLREEMNQSEKLRRAEQDDNFAREQRLKSELEKEKESTKQFDNLQVELSMILDAVKTVLMGGSVSDFEESFDVVRGVVDLRAELAAVKTLCEGCSGKAMVERIDSLTAQLAHKETVEQEREILVKRTLQSIGRPTEGLTVFLLVQEFVAALKIVESVRQYGVDMMRYILAYEPGHYGRDWRKKLAVHLSELLDACLRGDSPEGKK